ncbi:RNA polymerase sigma factor [Fulvivirga lutea]|uniref:Sigma-70 family RNA polymerase sigma factor n=1 Tax=Fulvivirga lutea TaxID=2810512 RepID=A0A975A088_9BACT|nr:sigma-70 family RNA polymerase sigma factor [Fulvivirga lutea]QSE97134.1 sigma-70 family RNA polymerase sigma factor [Fulvivirga lutea]
MSKSQQEFLEMVDKYQRVIHSVCRMYTDNTIEHEDLFQEILAQLWKGYQRFNFESKVSTWIYRVALYTAITYIKKVMRGREALKHISFSEADNQKETESDEELLRMAIQKLSESERAFVVLYLEDMSYKEMADILGISESNVGVKLNRIKQKLKTIMT